MNSLWKSFNKYQQEDITLLRVSKGPKAEHYKSK
jgi:hypothetical protein